MFAVLATEIHLMPDWTAFIQLGVFLIVLSVLYFLVFRPTIKILDRRRCFTDEARNEAIRANDEANTLEKRREELLNIALQDGALKRKQELEGKRREAEKIIAEARCRARSIMDSSEAFLEGPKGETNTAIAKEADTLAQDIVKRAIGASS